MAKSEKPQNITKKHMARQEREDLQTRNIKYVSIAVLAIVLILVGYAVIDAYYVTPNRAVAVVNDEEINTSDYQARVKFERLQLVNQFANTLQFMQSFEDESTMQYFQSTLQQINFQLMPEFHGQSVLDAMIEDVLIRHEANRLGISVSEADVDEYIAEAFGYFENGTPTPAPTSEPVPTSTLNPKQLTLVPQTPETDGIEIAPTPIEDPSNAPTEALPTPTVYTKDAFEENYSAALDNYNQSINVSEEQFRTIISAEILRIKVSDEITKDIPKEEEQVWARHILVASEEEAQDAITRLEAGEDFAALATELSTDTGSAANGGDLGWFGKGRMVPAFEAAAFGMEIGDVSPPVQSDFGWHLIQKLGHEIRPINDATYNQLQQTFFTDWLTTQREAADIQTDNTWQEVYPETPQIPPEFLGLLGQ